MKIDALKLLDGPITVEVDESAQVLQSEDDPFYRFVKGLTGSLVFSRMFDGKVLVRGTLTTRVQTDCVRCLEPVEMDLKADVTLVYVHDAALLDPIRRYEFPDDVAYFNGHTIEPLDDLRDLLLLDLPAYPACEQVPGKVCGMKSLQTGPLVFGSPEEETPRPDTNKPGATKGEDWKAALRRVSESRHPVDGS